MIILRHGRFISGNRIFRVGEILPETSNTKNLVENGLAEIIADVPKKSAKAATKIAPEKPEAAPKNDESNS